MSQGSAATGTAATRPVVQQTAAAAWSLPPGGAYRPRLPSPSYPTELPDTRTGPKSRLSIGLPEPSLLGPGMAPRPVRIVRIVSLNWSPVTDRTVVLSYHGRIGSVSLAPRRYSVRWSKGMLPRPLGTLPSSGSMHRWFPEVVPGEASGIACRKCAAAAPVIPEGQFRTRRDAIKVAPGQVTRTPVTVSGLHRGCTE